MIIKTLLSFLFFIPLPLMAEPAQLPSDLIDLSRWKLQLPEDTARPSHPDEVKQPELGEVFPSFLFLLKQRAEGAYFSSSVWRRDH